MKGRKFYPILIHKIYDLQNKIIIKMFNFDLIRDSQNKIIIKMFNFDLIRDSIAICKDIMIGHTINFIKKTILVTSP